MDHRLGQAGTQVKPLGNTVRRRTAGLETPAFTGEKAEGRDDAELGKPIICQALHTGNSFI